MARFVAVPGLPEEGLSDAQSILITAIKQNVELLAGLRDEADLQSKAVTKGDITVNLQPLQNLHQLALIFLHFLILNHQSNSS